MLRWKQLQNCCTVSISKLDYTIMLRWKQLQNTPLVALKVCGDELFGWFYFILSEVGGAKQGRGRMGGLRRMVESEAVAKRVAARTSNAKRGALNAKRGTARAGVRAGQCGRVEASRVFPRFSRYARVSSKAVTTLPWKLAGIHPNEKRQRRVRLCSPCLGAASRRLALRAHATRAANRPYHPLRGCRLRRAVGRFGTFRPPTPDPAPRGGRGNAPRATRWAAANRHFPRLLRALAASPPAWQHAERAAIAPCRGLRSERSAGSGGGSGFRHPIQR